MMDILLQSNYMKEWYHVIAILDLDKVTVFFLVPVTELILYPLFIKCTYLFNFSMTTRFLLGIFALILYELYLLGIELVVTYTSDLQNSTICFHHVNEKTLSQYWLIPPEVLYGIAQYIMRTSSLEFIVAQAPYSMRGLLFGIFICLIGLSAALASFCFGFDTLTKKFARESDAVHCALWLYGCMLFLTIVLFCVGVISKKWYTLRRRDECLPNEQKFAVDYYEKYLSQVS